jgi:hypothetical protein
VIHTALEPIDGIFLPIPHHYGLNHCFVALYFQKEKPRTLESKGSKTSYPLQIESENHCNKRVIRNVLEPTLRILKAFSHHLRMNHCFVALYFQIEIPSLKDSKAPRPLTPSKTILKINATKE